MTRKEKENNKKKYRPEVCQIIKNIREKFDAREDFDETMLPQLEVLAIWYQVFYDAYDELKGSGLSITTDRDNLQKSPLFDILRNSSSRIEAISREFGLTPSSFKRLTKEEDSKLNETSPLEKWMKQDGEW